MGFGPTIVRPNRLTWWNPEFDAFSIVPSHAKLKFNEKVLYKGTSFCFSVGGQDYLVSNWHIFSGRDRITGKPGHSKGGLPNRIRPFVLRSISNGFQWVAEDFDLVDQNGGALWLEHPVHGRKVDVGILPISFSPGTTMQPINELPTTDDMILEVGQSVYVIGYPYNLRGGKVWPIWKRASVASEPAENVDNLPLMLIDTAGYKGLSGAPVLAKQVDSYLSEPGLRKADYNAGTYYKFVGVYSGRRTDEQGAASQICEVWKSEVLLEIIHGHQPADISII